MTGITIRKARKNDVRAILSLIKELAEYEKAKDEVKVTLSELRRDGFGRKKIYECFVASLPDGKVVGMALYFTKYSTWKGKCIYLDDIIVTKTMRRKGIGKKLFEAVIAVAKKRKVRKLEWQVLHWNSPAINFYKKYDTVFDKEWVNCKLVFEK
jgi:GNAT superfamily N-acetyltransferase